MDEKTYYRMHNLRREIECIKALEQAEQDKQADESAWETEPVKTPRICVTLDCGAESGSAEEQAYHTKPPGIDQRDWYDANYPTDKELEQP